MRRTGGACLFRSFKNELNSFFAIKLTWLKIKKQHKNTLKCNGIVLQVVLDVQFQRLPCKYFLETRRFANLLNVQACKQVIYANLETLFCFKSKHVLCDSLLQIIKNLEMQIQLRCRID